MAETRESKRIRFDNSVVLLNVGGQSFRTSKETMRSISSSLFGVLVSERHRINFDEDGSIFIDRDPKHFRVILEYLRNRKQIPLENYSVGEIDEIRWEAEYYGLARLARSCRRFRLHDSHFMSCLVSKSGHFGAFTGLRHAAAIFDVRDPDNFEVTFACRALDQRSVDDSVLLNACINEPGVFVGLVPVDADLSLEWEGCANPLPTVNPGPFDTGATWDCSWSPTGREYPISPEVASKHWPARLYVPPALTQGIAFTISVCLFRNEKSNESTEYQSDGFLTQCISKGAVTNSGSNHSKWWDRCPASIALRFTRSEEKCSLRVRHNFEDEECMDAEINLESLGLDVRLPYRPVIFYGTKAMIDVHIDFSED